ncbi:unnamed protein product [Bursaphelenchus xylophilus]|uniref:(pine wood nematode) hypothetical protein n=1 Tax=Bursaphelenchus xylophilus TaxID=6326 RepID=A0A1I7RP92_BURXY|nr:unnamed protein product [Bursaphelenchus xylophilus]CAG9095618.1 unnamed protein product [Bursaphelenchus xylophilus]
MAERANFMRKEGNTRPNLNSLPLGCYQQYALDIGNHDFLRSFFLCRRSLSSVLPVIENCWISSSINGLSFSNKRNGFPLCDGPTASWVLCYTKPSKINLVLNEYVRKLDELLTGAKKISHLYIHPDIYSVVLIRLLSKCGKIESLECMSTLLKAREMKGLELNEFIGLVDDGLDFENLKGVKIKKLDIAAPSVDLRKLNTTLEGTEEMTISEFTFLALESTDFLKFNQFIPSLRKISVVISQVIPIEIIGNYVGNFVDKCFDLSKIKDVTLPEILFRYQLSIDIFNIENDYHAEIMNLEKEGVTIEQTLKENVDVSIEEYRIKWKKDKVELDLTLTLNVYQEHALKQIVEDCGINDEDFNEVGSDYSDFDGDY